jgi:glycosyltransferase involved in cell wall biosynthesis
MKLTILIPAYNEEGTIKQVIEGIPKKINGVDKQEILVIDDGSNDKTAEIAKNTGAVVFSSIKNNGLAKTIAVGFAKALERNSDITVILDADNQYDSKEISLIIEPILRKEADIVLGNRQVKKLDHMPVQKKIGNQIASKTLSMLVGMKISDGQTGFRAFTFEALKKIHLFSEYTYTQETIMQAKFKGLKIVEVPITFRKRYDKSRLISNIGTYAVRTASLLGSTIIYYKSIKFFGILSLILFSIGSVCAAFMINHYIITGMIRPYYAIISLAVLFLVSGAISTLMTVLSSISNRQSILLEQILSEIQDLKRIDTESALDDKTR